LQGFLFSFASPFALPGGAFVVRRDNDQGHASARIGRVRGTDHLTTSPVIDEGRREYLGVA
jgi:hypothetical protein